MGVGGSMRVGGERGGSGREVGGWEVRGVERGRRVRGERGGVGGRRVGGKRGGER